MPYHVKKVGSGFKVFKKGTNKALSKEPLTKAKAEAQMKAVEISEKKQKTHKMPDGTVMSGAKHSKDSKVISKSKKPNKKNNKSY